MAIPKNYPDISTPLTAEFLLNYCHPIGQVIYTTNEDFDPNVEWGGTWELDEDGVVYASKSNSNESPFNVEIGTIIGEDKHNLTINEMPSHRHATNFGGTAFGDGTGYQYSNTDGTSTQIVQAAGGGQAHNNIQRTKICNIWTRTA